MCLDGGCRKPFLRELAELAMYSWPTVIDRPVAALLNARLSVFSINPLATLIAKTASQFGVHS